MLESFLELLEGRRSEEIIWTADLEYWICGQRQSGTLDEKYEGENGRLRLCKNLGIMPYYWYEDFWLAEPVYDGIDVAEEKRGFETICIWKTPFGQLEKQSAFMVESSSQACIKHPVQSETDLKMLLYVLEHRHLLPTCLENYNRRCRLYAEYDGLPSIAMPRSPLSALAVEWCGIENLVYLMLDCPDLIRCILELFEKQEKPVLDAVCKAAPPLVLFADNLTSEVYTPYFDEFMAEPYRRRIDQLHAAGVRCAVHLDGTVRGLLPKLAEVGFDAVEALTPAPVGDVAVNEMRNLAGNNRVILWGGIPGAMFCKPYSWNDVQSHLEKLLDSWQWQRFVLGVADQVPPNGDIEICRKISEVLCGGPPKLKASIQHK